MTLEMSAQCRNVASISSRSSAFLITSCRLGFSRGSGPRFLMDRSLEGGFLGAGLVLKEGAGDDDVAGFWALELVFRSLSAARFAAEMAAACSS